MKKTGTSVLQTQRKSVTDFRKTTRRYSQASITQTLSNAQTSRNQNISKTNNSIKIFDNNKNNKNVVVLNNNYLPNTLPESLVNITKRNKSGVKQKNQKGFSQPSVASKRKSVPPTLLASFKAKESINLLMANSNKVRKIVWNQNQYNATPVILSADFIINQDQFWDKSTISVGIVKNWKALHQLYYVILIIRNQKSFVKIRQFVNLHELPIHSIYYQKYKHKYTSDYTPIIKQINRTFSHNIDQIPILLLLKLNSKDFCDYSSFDGRVPITQVTFERKINVYYLRAEENMPGLQKVINIFKKALSGTKQQQEQPQQNQHIQKLTSIDLFIQEYYEKVYFQGDEEEMRKFRQQNKREISFIEQEQAQERVENLKREMINLIIKSKGRQFQHEGNSVYYLVGDFIKRNYNRLIDSSLLIPKPMKQRITESSSRTNNFPELQSSRKRNKMKIDINIDFYQYFQG